MSVFVDQPIHIWKNIKWCHLTADTLSELHEFAGRLGLKQSWFQNHDLIPHYDITETKRQKAIALGAIPISTSEAGKRVRKARKEQKKSNKQS